MIQIIAQRNGFVYTTPKRIFSLSLESVYTQYAELLSTIPESERYNLYYTLAHHTGYNEAHLPARTATTFEYQTALAWDIDKTDTHKAFEYLDIVSAVLGCPREALILVTSGNGTHVIANLQSYIRSNKYFKDNKQAYGEICMKINHLISEKGLNGKCDPVIFEPARVLRMPGTVNVKPNLAASQCVIHQHSTTKLDLDLYRISGLDKMDKENVNPKEVRRQYPTPDFPTFATQCEFIKWTMHKPEEVHEPHVFDLFSLLTCAPPTATVEFAGTQHTPHSVGEFVFSHASSSPSLARTIFEDKWETSARYGARKCETINERWGGCSDCKYFGRVPTPLAIKSEEHIATESTGFWVINGKGNFQYPEYSDLAKVYCRTKPCVTTEQERILSFKDTHYLDTTPMTIKSWVENTVQPTHPLREVHRNEFVNKIKAVSAVPPEREVELFSKSIEGKLNFKNGVLDVLTGELLVPSPRYGFRYCLDHEYDPLVSSELFMEWVQEITESRQDLMEAILDMMAYVLWPKFDDHIFHYLVGEGSNGKSTLLHIIEKMVGKGNASSVSLQQLATNRFAPAALDGRLVNLSEESSGGKLTLDHLNIIKLLSAGGDLHVEEKFTKGFTLRNKAKLIFSANKTPIFLEKGKAITRRLCALPFDYKITRPDSLIESKLLSEIPGIVSILVRRVQDNVRENGGKFVCNRGGEDAIKLQKKVLMAGNNVATWAEESIESSISFDEKQYITIGDAYMRYTEWCDVNGHKITENKQAFSTFMYENIITKASSQKDNRVSLNGHKVSVFKRTRFKKEMEDAESA